MQQAFLEKLKAAKQDASLIEKQDWLGVRLIIDSIINQLPEL